MMEDVAVNRKKDIFYCRTFCTKSWIICHDFVVCEYLYFTRIHHITKNVIECFILLSKNLLTICDDFNYLTGK